VVSKFTSTVNVLFDWLVVIELMYVLVDHLSPLIFKITSSLDVGFSGETVTELID